MIIGAGFGGLTAAKALGRAPVQLTVIDRHNYHLFQPLALSGRDRRPLARRHRRRRSAPSSRRQRNATVLLGRVTGVDTAIAHGDDRSPARPYDTLIVATGARHAYFGHDEWEPVAPGLKKIEDATDIRRRILLAFE